MLMPIVFPDSLVLCSMAHVAITLIGQLNAPADLLPKRESSKLHRQLGSVWEQTQPFTLDRPS